ncbi:fibroblast growth factor 1-like isoform X2 [Argiope bruennichi]|uniref:fibroblast growth factor 1-like isoform X2 n=1 Tax=Argiope bruennichi TaxID=94029 RepID=UPI002494F439|nr:fibroblast growth factor 1-like isoform X2 [Argiope bruennichi]
MKKMQQLITDPIALGPPNKMATEEELTGPSYAGLSMETDRGIPGHIGKEKQLHSATGYNIVIDSEGNVYGTREPYNQEAILQFHSRAPGEVQIKGKKTDMYLAMNDKGKVYAESDPESENTWFKEEYEDGWNYYTWLGNQKDWYLGIKKSGKMKRGHRTRRDQNAVKFVPRSAEPSYN